MSRHEPELRPLAVDARGAARMAGIGRSTWLKLASAGRTPRPVRLGRRTLWHVGELDEWLAAGAPERSRWDIIRKSRDGQR